MTIAILVIGAAAVGFFALACVAGAGHQNPVLQDRLYALACLCLSVSILLSVYAGRVSAGGSMP